VGDFSQATSIEPIEPGRYATEIDGTWSVGEVPNGGYLLALVLRAVLAESSQPHPIATSAFFLSPPKAGPAVVEVSTLRVGRTTGTLQARLIQADQALMHVTTTTGELDARSVPEWNGPAPESVAELDDCVPALVDLPDGTHVGLLEHVDLRLDPQTLGWFSGRPAGSLAMRGHLRLPDGTQPDPLVLALAIDALPPTVFGLGRLGWAPTVQLSLLTRALPAAGWLTVHLRGRLVRDDWFDEEAEVYDANGDLVAQSRQIARVRVT
jgi:acyl-CoA thioesterase